MFSNHLWVYIKYLNTPISIFEIFQQSNNDETNYFFLLEHTKLIFNKHEILNLHNLFVQQSFMRLYKVFKTHTPISIFEIFQQSNRKTNFLVKVPDVPLKTSKCNFAYKSSFLWNTLIGKILNDSEASDNGIVIMGSSENQIFVRQFHM